MALWRSLPLDRASVEIGIARRKSGSRVPGEGLPVSVKTSSTFIECAKLVESSRYNVLFRAAGYPKSHSLPGRHTGMTERSYLLEFR